MHVSVHEGLEALEALKPEWDGLLRAHSRQRPFLMHEWLTTAWRHFGGGDRLLTVGVRDESGLAGLAPLRHSRCLLGRQLTFAVDPADCRDLITREGAEFGVLEAILQWLKHDFTDWDLLRLRSVCILSPTGRLLPTVARYAGFPSVGWLCATCAYIELPATFDEFLDRMPGRLRRKKHAQARRKLVREHGEPEVRLLEGEEVTAEVVDRFFALHGRAWASRGGSVMLRDRRVLAFHRDLVAAPAPVGVPTLLLMAVGGRDAAGYYGFRLGRTFFAYMSAYDPDLSVYSVGGQATLALVERGIELGWERIDLMKGAERYKLDYTHHCGQTVDHCVTRSRATMRLFCTAAALRGRLCP